MKINRSLLTNFNPDNDVTFYQNVTAESLAGTGTRMVVASSTGLLSTQAIPSGTIGGSGTANYVPKFATGTSLGNSVMYEGSNNIGIYTTSASERLTIGSGNIKLYTLQNIADQYRYIGTEYDLGNGNNRAEIRFAIDGADTKTRITFHVANGGGTINEALRITSGNNLIVNPGTDTGERLQVNGTAKITSNLVVDTNTLYVDATTDKVGIGTASPSEKLEVNGNIKTSSPSGGTAKPWKLGAAASATGDTQNTKIEVEIDGVLYYLIAYTV